VFEELHVEICSTIQIKNLAILNDIKIFVFSTMEKIDLAFLNYSERDLAIFNYKK